MGDDKEKKKATILVVDDTPINLDLLFRYLNRAGFRILVAQNGIRAIQQAEQAQPDIILLDVMMPDVDGFETCRRLKKNKSTQHIPVIFMTALSDVEHKIKGFSVGAVDYVTKPVERQEVLARVATHLTLVRLQRSLQAEIKERKKIESALREYMTELEGQNEELDAFAHTVAHDLKNPLGIIRGMADVLVSDYVSLFPENLRSYLHTMARNADKAVNIVDELLILASVRQKEVEAETLNMGEIVQEAQQRLSHQIKESKAEVITPSEWPVAMGYAPWIEEVWVNYLSNAIKYGNQPPKVELGATTQKDQDRVRFWVKDNGPGLTEEEQARLFTPFTQLKNIRAEGHGLGLSIVRRIVEKLGGEVGVESSKVADEGCIFSFTLPTE